MLQAKRFECALDFQFRGTRRPAGIVVRPSREPASPTYQIVKVLASGCRRPVEPLPSSSPPLPTAHAGRRLARKSKHRFQSHDVDVKFLLQLAHLVQVLCI